MLLSTLISLYITLCMGKKHPQVKKSDGILIVAFSEATMPFGEPAKTQVIVGTL